MLCIKCKKEIPDGSSFCNHCGKQQTPKKYVRRRGNGQGTAFKRGRTWTASAVIGWRWDDQDRRQPVRKTKGGFSTKSEALEYIPTLRNAPEAKEATTLSSLWTLWSQNSLPKLSNSKQTAYKIAYKKIAPIVHYEISTLTIQQLQDIVNSKARTFYPARDIKTVLVALYTRAVAEQETPTNLAEYIELPQLVEKEQEAFTEEEQNAFWADYAEGNHFTGYILLMIYTGMMPGELFDAKKSMIDFEAQTIIGCGKKTRKRKETPIVLCDAIIPVLQTLCDNTKGDKLLRMNRDNFYKAYRETLERCGVRPLKPYSCRHTTATALALGDIPLSVVKEVMRHSKITTTQRYVHVGVAPMLDAVNKLDIKAQTTQSEALDM